MKWWEESWYAGTDDRRHIYEVKKMLVIHCPVCKADIGERIEGTVSEGHCTECKATFTFMPGDNAPVCKMDNADRKKCHCTNCRQDDPCKEVLPYIPPQENDDLDIP